MTPAPPGRRDPRTGDRRGDETGERRAPRNPLIAAVVILGMLFAGLVAQSAAAPGSQAAAPLTVAQAIATQNGSTAAVTGYVVGQPTAATTVVRSGFTADTALALADSAAETSTGQMLYVQITTRVPVARSGCRPTRP